MNKPEHLGSEEQIKSTVVAYLHALKENPAAAFTLISARDRSFLDITSWLDFVDENKKSLLAYQTSNVKTVAMEPSGNAALVEVELFYDQSPAPLQTRIDVARINQPDWRVTIGGIPTIVGTPY